MELIFRQRLDRPDAKGRAAVFADLHWAGGHREKLPTGVKCLPAHWRPANAKRVATAAENANGLNLRLARLQTAIASVFQKAEAEQRPEASVTIDELRAAVAASGAGSKRAKAAAPEAAADAPLPATATWQELYDRWQAENHARLATGTLSAFRQCVDQLVSFDASLRVASFTRERLAAYTTYLYGQGKKDSTVGQHYWFLRECFQLTGRAVPKWLGNFSPRTGRALTLLRQEVLALAALEVEGVLARERDVFLFQLLLLLRDSDLRALRAHHVRQVELPGRGPWLCAALYQDKTGEEVVLPLPALAATIWQRYGGRLPVLVNSARNRRIKELGQLAGLTRPFVEVSFSGKTRHEEVRPVCEAIGTHTARHTGAALLVWASEGDQTLKECALGHVSQSAYGYDALERYGPKLLSAWEVVFPAVGGA